MKFLHLICKSLAQLIQHAQLIQYWPLKAYFFCYSLKMVLEFKVSAVTQKFNFFVGFPNRGSK